MSSLNRGRWLSLLLFTLGSVDCGGHAHEAPPMSSSQSGTGGRQDAIATVGGTTIGGASAVVVSDAGPGERLVNYLEDDRYPDDFWQKATYAESLVDGVKLEQALDAIQSHGWEVRSFLVARNGRLVFERYGWSSGTNSANSTPHQVVPSERQSIFSVTKSITGALVGNAIQDGLIAGVSSTLADWFSDNSQVMSSPEKSGITLDNLLTMRSGLTFAEGESAVFQDPKPAESLVSRALASVPGAAWNYSSGDAHIVSEVIHRATGMTPLDYAKQKLFGPLGIIDPPWDSDATGTNLGGFGLSLTAREMARFGELYRNGGVWANRQVVPAAWVENATSFKCATLWGMNYGYYWFLPSLNDFFVAIGFNGQQIFVSRNYGLVVVFTGNVPSEEANTDYSQLIASYVVPAMK